MSRPRHLFLGWLGALPLLSVVGLCMILPVAVLVGRALLTPEGVAAWGQVLGQERMHRALINSIWLGASCAFISTVIGTPVAWIISRMPFARRATWLGVFNVTAHFGGIGLAFAYVATLGAFGMLTLLLQGAGIDFGAPSRDSFVALVITYEYANIPLFVLLVLPAMAVVRDEWAEAAEVAGASRVQFWRRVGGPVLAPFVLGGGLLSFTWAIGIYGIAFALAGSSPVNATPLLTLQMGQSLAADAINGPWRAAVLAVVLIVIAVAALAGYRLLVRRGMRWFGGRLGSGPSVNGRGNQSRGGRLGQRILLAGMLVYFALPLIAVFLHSVAARWTTGALPDAYTLDYWLSTWGDSRATSAVVTSVLLASLTSVLTVALVVPAVYTSRVVNRNVRTPLELAAAIPFALPFLVIGIALLQFSGTVAPGLQGTIPLLIAGYVSITFPFVYWAVDGAMAAARVELLSEAATVAGASTAQTIVRVVLPNIKTGVAIGAMLCFATVIGEYAMVSVLASSVNTIPVWSTHLLLDREDPSLAPLSVVTLTVFVLLLVASLVVARITHGVTPRQVA